MKKLFAVLFAICLISSVFALSVAAGPEGVTENPPIDAKKGSPVIDGSINDDEGWSKAAVMDYDTMGFFWHVNPLTMKGNVRFAWDDDNFYYCADITDGLEATHEITGEVIPAGFNSFIYSTGLDDIDVRDDGSAFGYNGDVFGIFIDPLGTMVYSGFTGNDDSAPCYLVGLFEDEGAKMFREEINPGDVTDKVELAGTKTEGGWCFEAAIPWDMILNDVEEVSFGDCVVTKDMLFAEDSYLRIGAMYHDRFNDEEAGEVATWGCFITVPGTMLDGTPGHLGTGTNVMSYGITMNMLTAATDTLPETDDTTAVPIETDPASDTTVNTEKVETQEIIVDVTDEKGNTVTDEKGNKVTQKVTQKLTDKSTTKKQNSGNSNGTSNNAQTLDIMLAVSVGTLAVSGIGFAVAKKRR